jgi:nicotinamidase-related amidase
MGYCFDYLWFKSFALGEFQLQRLTLQVMRMPKFAVLLMDLQKDFLDTETGRMAVEGDDAESVLKMANQVLAKAILADALPILVVNQFSPAAHVANFFRKGAAIMGTPGAVLDGRLSNTDGIKIISKSHASAFTNPELDKVLLEFGVQDLYVLGVYAEGCVCATVIDAIELGFTVHVLADAVASNTTWKKRFALWTMKRAGADIIEGMPQLTSASTSLPVKHAIW